MGKKFEGVSIRQYAISRHVSYETVRRQVTKYSKELKGHTKRIGNAVKLDEEAQAFLDQHRMPKNVVYQMSDEIQKNIVEDLQKQLQEAKEEIIALQRDKIQLLEDHKAATMLLETTKQELETFKPMVFGLYRKVTK